MTQDANAPALPPLPEPAQVSYVTDSVMRRHEVRSFTASQTLAFGQQCRDEARAQVANELLAEIALEGFGCACEPNVQCSTCRARIMLTKALGPFIRALKTTPPQGEPR